MDLLVKVAEIKGKCPVYQVGHSFRIADGFRLVAEKPLCMHSLASLMPYYVALSRGISPVELGLAKEGNFAYVQCLDPCERTGGGTVVFAISLGRLEGGEGMPMKVVYRAEFFWEGDLYVGLVPALNVSSFGSTLEEARNFLQEAVQAFIEECERMGTLEEVIEEAGFSCKGDTWFPRQPISAELLTVG